MNHQQPSGDVRSQCQPPSTALSPSLLGQQPDDDDDDTEGTIIYPPIIDVLERMDVTMPLLNMPQYEAVLIEHGIAYVNNAVGISDRWFVDVVGMPIGVMHSFFDLTRRSIQQARKGKGRAGKIYGERYDSESSDKENYDPKVSSYRRQQSVEV